MDAIWCSTWLSIMAKALQERPMLRRPCCRPSFPTALKSALVRVFTQSLAFSGLIHQDACRRCYIKVRHLLLLLRASLMPQPLARIFNSAEHHAPAAAAAPAFAPPPLPAASTAVPRLQSQSCIPCVTQHDLAAVRTFYGTLRPQVAHPLVRVPQPRPRQQQACASAGSTAAASTHGAQAQDKGGGEAGALLLLL